LNQPLASEALHQLRTVKSTHDAARGQSKDLW
jgi:hypothetical protein